MNELNLDDITPEQALTLFKELALNEGFGCYTRQGFEKLIWPRIVGKAKWIIFFDIDDMHGLNQQYGYEGVNAIIKQTLALREGDYMAGQWFSGDEFIVVITDENDRKDISNPVGFSIRLAHHFKENGAPATFAIAPVISPDLMTNVMPAHKLVQEAKVHLQRGTISIAPGDPK